MALILFAVVGGAIEKVGGAKFVQEVKDLLASVKHLDTAGGIVPLSPSTIHKILAHRESGSLTFKYVVHGYFNMNVQFSLVSDMHSQFNKTIHTFVRIIKRINFVRSGKLQKCEYNYVIIYGA